MSVRAGSRRSRRAYRAPVFEILMTALKLITIEAAPSFAEGQIRQRRCCCIRLYTNLYGFNTDTDGGGEEAKCHFGLKTLDLGLKPITLHVSIQVEHRLILRV